MITETTIDIAAPAGVVWDVYAAVTGWPGWTTSVTRVEPLDGAELAVGRRFRIRQPRLPELVWEVTELDPGASWTWRQRSPGGTTLAFHQVSALDADHARVRLGLDQRGPVGVAAGLLTRRLTRRYLDTEARGLKARSEQQHRRDAATA